MKTFSISRFVAHTASELKTNKRSILLNFSGMLAFILIIYASKGLRYFIALSSGAELPDMASRFVVYQSSRTLVGLIFVVSAASILSAAFKNYHQSLTASLSMLLPVSNGEKFLSSVLINVVIWPLLLGVLYFSVDYLFFYIYKLDTFVIDFSLNTWSSGLKLVMLPYFLFAASAFLLGSIVFRRLQIVWTTVWLAGGFFIVSFIYSHLVDLIIAFNNSDPALAHISILNTFEICFMLALAALFTWISWLEFCKLQIR